MDSIDLATFQNAIQLAHIGQTRAAYKQFCALSSKYSNRQSPDLLLWIAETTPSFEEANRAIKEASSIAPHHPGLPQAKALLARRNSHIPPFQIDDTYCCPFCATAVKPIIIDRVSSTGWILFAILIVCLITVEFCWLGLFIRETVVQCPVCNANLRGLV